MNIERRFLAAQGDMRAAGSRRIVGHAAIFNSLSQDLGGFRERIVPGAFAEAIRTDDVRALLNHDPNILLGRNRSGTLRMHEDSRGLAVEIDLPDTSFARDLLTLIERGDVSQMSFAFSVRPGGQEWAKDDNGTPIRTLKNVRLFDVSPVTFPAYTATDVAPAGTGSPRADIPAATPNLVKARNLQASMR